MPETCENWVRPFNSGIFYARQTHEIYHILPYSVDFKVELQIQWVRHCLVNVVLFGIEGM